jgi:hypothetical protein
MRIIFNYFIVRRIFPLPDWILCVSVNNSFHEVIQCAWRLFLGSSLFFPLIFTLFTFQILFLLALSIPLFLFSLYLLFTLNRRSYNIITFFFLVLLFWTALQNRLLAWSYDLESWDYWRGFSVSSLIKSLMLFIEALGLLLALLWLLARLSLSVWFFNLDYWQRLILLILSSYLLILLL